MEHATPPVTTRQVSVAEAARELGISAETVRRRIKSGQLQAVRAIRPQGTVWEVTLPLTTPRGVPPLAPVTGHSVASLSESEHATPDVAFHPSPRLAGHTSDAAGLVASVARLIAELAEVRVISDRRADQLVSQGERIAELERTIADLRVELATVRASQPKQDANPRPVEPEVTTDALKPASRRGWRFWLLGALAVAVVGSASCQSSASVKHPGLCTAARATMDYIGDATAGQPAPNAESARFANVLDVAAKVC